MTPDPVAEPLFSTDECAEPDCGETENLLVYVTENDIEVLLCREHVAEWANDE